MLALFAIALAAGPEALPVLTLDQAIAEARAHQPALQQARANAAAAGARADQARAALLPQLSGSADYSRSTANFSARPGSLPSGLRASSRESGTSYDYWTLSASASQLVWDFSTPQRFRAAKALAEAAKDSARQAELELLADVRAAYFAAAGQRELARVAADALANQRRHLEQARALVKVGSRPEIDLAQAQADEANARVQLVEATNAYALARARLRQAMGRAGGDFEVAEESFAELPGEAGALDPLAAEAERSRPDLAAAERQLRAQELTLRASRGGYGPSLGVGASASDVGPRLDELTWNWALGATLSWPLFQGLATRAQVREAEAGLEALAAQRDALRLEVRLEVEDASLSVGAAKETLLAAGQAQEASRERLRLAEARYAAGAGNIIELGDAQSAYTSARAQVVRAKYDLATARAKLSLALGRG